VSSCFGSLAERHVMLKVLLNFSRQKPSSCVAAAAQRIAIEANRPRFTSPSSKTLGESLASPSATAARVVIAGDDVRLLAQ
jgi:hypothetical protein